MIQTIYSASYVILDGARMGENLRSATEMQPNYVSLLHGENKINLAEVAPYLFQFGARTKFGNWLLNHGWGNAWGIFIVSQVSLEQLRLHLRKFLIVEDEDHKKLFFRYYDPRVLRTTLQTFDSLVLRKLFGPIEEWIAEDQDPLYCLRFKLNQAELQSIRERCSK